MIVDAHTYVNPDPAGFGPRYNASLEFLLRNLDEAGIDRAAIYPIAADSPKIKRTQNAYVAECCARYPERLLGFASVHPFEEADPARRLREDVERYGLVGLKLHPRWMGFAASDPRIFPLVEQAADLGIPVAIDCMLWRPTPLRMQVPFHIDELCKAVPSAKIIMCHTGGFHFLDALAVALANDNCYFDLSLMLTYFHGTPFADQFFFVLQKIGAQRLVYGSDHPQETAAECYPKARAILAERGFSAEDQEWIFGKTFLSLLPGGAD